MANTNNQQQSGLSPRAPDFTPVRDLAGPGAPGVPAPVDSLGGSGVALMHGGQMCAMFILLVLGRTNIAVRVDTHTFVTARGDRISRPPGRRPQQGRLGGPYPRLDEVGEQSVHGFK